MFKTLFVLIISVASLKASTTQSHWESLNKDANFKLNKQSFCIKEQEKLIGSRIDAKVRPASVSKLYTTLWAFETLSHKHRFETKFKIQNNSLYIFGSGDPFFVTENLIVLMGKLEQLGYNSFDKVVFDRNFYFNWRSDSFSVKTLLEKTLNTQKWDQQIQETKTRLEETISSAKLDFQVPSQFSVKAVQFSSKLKLKSNLKTISHSSLEIKDQFKPINMFSNNFYTDQIFLKLGGTKKFNQYIKTRFQLSDKDTYFYTGSGLGENWTSCRTSLMVLEALKGYATNNNISLKDFIGVAGSDEGTLKNRFNESYSNKVIAKTGTLRHTSTLSGFLGKDQQVLFSVFNHTREKEMARELQNNFIQKIIDFKKYKAFSYRVEEFSSIKGILIK